MDYFSQPGASAEPDGNDSRPRSPDTTIPPAETPLEAVMTRQASANQQGPAYVAPPSILLRRLQSSDRFGERVDNFEAPGVDSTRTGRRRSTSAPQRPQNTAVLRPSEPRRQATTTENLPVVVEEQSDATAPQLLVPPARTGRIRAASNAAKSIVPGRSRASSSASRPTTARRNYESDVVDILDVIDPEVSTLNTLTNVQNTLFVPYLGRYFDRRQTYDLSRHSTPSPTGEEPPTEDTKEEPTPLASPKVTEDQDNQEDDSEEKSIALKPLSHSHTLSSVMSGTSIGHNYAVLPHGTLLEGWSEEDKAALNDHVRHLLHSRRAKFKRSMRAFGKFARKPMGFLVTLWASLLTFWGAAWVIFLIGWIYVGERQAYFIEICDQILTALFCVVGIGLAPFRAVDTYHMIYIAHYHFLTWRLRREQALPQLQDPNDLPEPQPGGDLELARAKSLENVVLTPEQQAKLVHHQTKFSRSHTFYKPHETFTHNAFSIHLLMVIVILFDCHSLLQMALGGTTWGIYYRVRPKALTAVILSCSITCNISAGITISIGDRRSRKKEVVEQILRQTLTEEAMRKLKKEKGLISSKKTEPNESDTAHTGDAGEAVEV